VRSLHTACRLTINPMHPRTNNSQPSTLNYEPIASLDTQDRRRLFRTPETDLYLVARLFAGQLAAQW
jgi:hypothetical protein